jgi:outer membrane protein
VKMFSPIRTMCIAACAMLTIAGQARGQAITDSKVHELLAQAQVQLQNQQQAAGKVAAGPALNLTMDDAVRKAVDQNIDLTVGRLNPQLSDLSIAQVLGAYRPTLGATFGDNWNRSQGTSQLSGGQAVETGRYTFNTNISQVMPYTGGTATLSWNNSRQQSNSNNASYNPSWTSGLTLSFAQPLVRNLKIDNNRQSLATARIARENADVTLRALMINTVANTKNAYWDLVYALQAVEAAKTSLGLAQKLVEDNRTRVEIGTMAPIDIVSAQAEAATRQQTLVSAEATRQTAELALKRLLVSGTSDPLWSAQLNPVDRPPTDVSEEIDLPGALRTALEKRTDIVTARKNLQSSDVSIRYLRNQILPSADLTATYGSSGTGGPFLQRNSNLGGSVINTIPGGYTDALGFLRKLAYPTWSAQVQVSYPIGTSAADANLARAKVQYQQSVVQLKALELSIATDLTNAAMTVQSNFQQVQAAAASRALSLKRLEAEQSKFDVGMSTNYNVVLAQRDYVDAQNSELRAILNYRKALVDFQRKQETSSGGSGGVSTVSTGG